MSQIGVYSLDREGIALIPYISYVLTGINHIYIAKPTVSTVSRDSWRAVNHLLYSFGCALALKYTIFCSVCTLCVGFLSDCSRS